MAMLPEVSYIPYATYSREQTGNIIKFTHFEEGGLLSENRNGTEIRDESDNNSTITPLISAAKMYKMSPVDESDNENVYKLMLEEIFDRIQYQPSLNRREVRYNICDYINKDKRNEREHYYQHDKIVKSSHKVFKAVVIVL